MRVIAGTSRGRRLVTFQGRNVRPTPDRVREALFSILHSKLGSFSGIRVLDLFAGSGALAIEALSRGALSACLVEKSNESIKIIRDNLDRCQMTDKANLVIKDAWQALPGFKAETFDLVFVDPPYGQRLAERAVDEVGRIGILSKIGFLCAETGAVEILPEISGCLYCVERRRYGTIMLHFYSNSPEGLA